MEGSQKMFENGCFFCGTSNILYIANAKLFPLGIKLSYLQSDMKTIEGKLVDFEKRIQNWSGMGGGGGVTPRPPSKKCQVSKMLLMTKNDYIGPKRKLLKKKNGQRWGGGFRASPPPPKSTQHFKVSKFLPM